MIVNVLVVQQYVYKPAVTVYRELRETYCYIAGRGKEQKDAGVKPFCALLLTVQESRKQLQGYIYVYNNWEYLYCACYNHVLNVVFHHSP